MANSSFCMKDHHQGIRQLLEISNTPQASIHYEQLGDSPQTATINCHRSQTSPGRDLPSSGPDIIYPIASYTKLLINYAYVNLLSHESYRSLGLSWESLVCDVFRKFRKKRGKPATFQLFGNPSINQLLKHVKSIAPINQYLLAPDGSLILSEQEFLHLAPLITEDRYREKYPDREWIEYSNANHILAGILLQDITGLGLQALMHELVFSCLNMTQTFMDEHSLASSVGKVSLVEGYQVSATGDRKVLSPRKDVSDAVGAAAFGAFSSTQDIAKFNRSLLVAIDDVSNNSFQWEKFFCPDYSHENGASMALGGVHCGLDSVTLGIESLSRSLVPLEELSTYTLGSRRDGTQCKAYFKDGCIDGYTCSTYTLLNDRTFVIVLTNSSGPLDVSGHIVRYILQEALHLSPRADIFSSVTEELTLCSKSLKELESQDLDSDEGSGNFQDLAGNYQNTRYLQQLTITPDGALKIHGEKLNSSPMKLVRVSPSTVRISPGAAGFGIERWTVWRDLSFEIVRHLGEPKALVRSEKFNCYEKIHEVSLDTRAIAKELRKRLPRRKGKRK